MGIAGELDQMRAEVERLALPDTCDLYNDATPRAAVARGVSCRLAPISAVFDPDFIATGDRYANTGQWHLTLPLGTAVAPGWQARMQAGTASPSLAGRVFAVVGLADGSYATSLRLRVEELRP